MPRCWSARAAVTGAARAAVAAFVAGILAFGVLPVGVATGAPTTANASGQHSGAQGRFNSFGAHHRLGSATSARSGSELPAGMLALAYAVAALSYSYTETPRAAQHSLGALCTPQWAAELSTNADGGGGYWAAIVAAKAVATARILAVYPSLGPGPGQRLEVTAVVTVTATSGRGARLAAVHGDALAVDVVDAASSPNRHRWLVGWSG